MSDIGYEYAGQAEGIPQYHPSVFPIAGSVFLPERIYGFIKNEPKIAVDSAITVHSLVDYQL